MAVGDSYQVPLSDLSMEKTVRDRNSRTSKALRELIGEAGTGGGGGGGGTGPKGDKGDPGIQGIQGVKGDKGDTGAAGTPGSRGLQGEKGDKGDTGAQGAKGDTGPKGADGSGGGGSSTMPLVARMNPFVGGYYPTTEVTAVTETGEAPAYAEMRYLSFNSPIKWFSTRGARLSDAVQANWGWNRIIASGIETFANYDIEFWHTGKSFSIQFQSYAESDIQIWADDMIVRRNYMTSSTFGTRFLNVEFATSKARRIYVQMGKNPLGVILTSGDQSIAPAAPRMKVAFVADSFGEGAASLDKSMHSRNIPGVLKEYTGWDIYNLSMGGSGYVEDSTGGTTGPGRFGSTERIDSVAAITDLELLIVYGGANDANYPLATTTAAYAKYFSDLASRFPSLPVVVVGIQSAIYTDKSELLDQMNSALRAAADAAPNVIGFIDQRNPAWMDGIGNEGAKAQDGNADLFRGSDQIHPSRAGNTYLGARLADALAEIGLPAIAGGSATVSKALRLRDLPDKLAQDAVTPFTTTFASNTSATSIASGYSATQFPNVAGALTLVGCKQSDLVNASGSGLYGPRWKAASDGTSGTINYNTSSFGVDLFVAGSPFIEFVIAVSNQYALKIWVDGRPITDLPQLPSWTGNAPNTVKVALGDSNPHRVRVMVMNAAMGEVYVGPNGSIWPSELKGPRMFVLGDSLSQGTNINTGVELGTWFPRFAHYIGAEDYWNGAIQGTGPTTAFSGYPNYVTRATNDMVPSAADLILIGTHYNSRTDTVANVQAAMRTVIDKAKGMASAPQIVVIGAPDPTGLNAAPLPTMDAGMIAVCAEKGVPYISPLTGNVYNAAGAVVLAGSRWFTAANKTAFIGGDNIHPNDLGHKYFAARMLEAFKALLDA